MIRKWLEYARVGRGLRQDEMAKKLGMTRSYYSMIEDDARQKDLRLSTVVKLSAALGIPISKIIEYETE